MGLSNLAFLSGFTMLERLWAWGNDLTDATFVTGLTSLSDTLFLETNYIASLAPLVANTAIGDGTIVALSYNCLDLTAGSQAMNDIDTLIARGALVSYETQKITLC